jgi:hypothetical protein
MSQSAPSFHFYMSQNTPGRKDYIMDKPSVLTHLQPPTDYECSHRVYFIHSAHWLAGATGPGSIST